MDIPVQALEAAINYWRERRPSSGAEQTLSREVSLLATPYARLIMERRASLPLATLDLETQSLLRSALGPT